MTATADIPPTMAPAGPPPRPKKAPRLTDFDRARIADARALAAASNHGEIREHLTGRRLIEPGDLGDRDIYPFAFGVARSLLEGLADLAERLGG